jgi:hypothetical protein
LETSWKRLRVRGEVNKRDLEENRMNGFTGFMIGTSGEGELC